MERVLQVIFVHFQFLKSRPRFVYTENYFHCIFQPVFLPVLSLVCPAGAGAPVPEPSRLHCREGVRGEPGGGSASGIGRTE